MTKIIYCPSLMSGEVPSSSIGPKFGGRADYGFSDWANSGCMDAPDLMPAGSMAYLEDGPAEISKPIEKLVLRNGA